MADDCMILYQVSRSAVLMIYFMEANKFVMALVAGQNFWTKLDPCFRQSPDTKVSNNCDSTANACYQNP